MHNTQTLNKCTRMVIYEIEMLYSRTKEKKLNKTKQSHLNMWGMECSGIWKHKKTIKWNQQWIPFLLGFLFCLIGLRWLFFSLSLSLSLALFVVFFYFIATYLRSNPRFFISFFCCWDSCRRGTYAAHGTLVTYLTAAQRPRVCNVVSGFQLSHCMPCHPTKHIILS